MSALTVSVLRFTAALTLYSFEQFERSLNLDPAKMIDSLGGTLDSLSNVLKRDLAENKKDTLESVKKASKDMVDRTMEGMEIMDPREVIKASNELLQKTSEVTSKWVSQAAESVDKKAHKG